VSKTLNRADSVVRGLLSSLATFEPADKVAPHLWQQNYDSFVITKGDSTINYVLNSDSTLNLLVAFAPLATGEAIEAALDSHTRSRREISKWAWRVRATRADLTALASLDAVVEIDPSPPPYAPDNDNTRQTVNVDAVQQWDAAAGHALGLGGSGVQVGVFDFGLDEQHDDFREITAGALGASRVVLSDGAARWHGTMVAGVIAGNGWRSDKNDNGGTANGGAPYQWRGMAPEAQLIDAAVFDVAGSLDFQTSNVLKYIRAYGMDVSNHSYHFEPPGGYGLLSAIHDRLMRGDEWIDTTPIPPRLEAFAAGNRGNAVGYFSLTGELKNALSVGNWYTAQSRIERNSSLGPTYDGRIKPDVVAPGTFVRSTGYWPVGENAEPCQALPNASAGRRNFYGVDCGTSLAAPVVTGVLALVLQQYSATYARNLDNDPPLPSTLRAVVIQSARDIKGPVWFTTPDPKIQAFPGPDFVTGFGLVDAQGAVDLVKQRRIIEDQLGATCESKTYKFVVTAPFAATEPDAITVTLAWDDYASLPVTDPTVPRLINDLDLVLVDPAGGRHYPWRLDQEPLALDSQPLPPDAQVCGSSVLVRRRLTPMASVVPATDIVPADLGPDHLNTVEQVVAHGVAGRWKAVVTGFNLDAGFQRFSLAGISTGLWTIAVNPKTLCAAVPSACRPWLPDICRRYPRLCERRQEIPVRRVGPTLTFEDLNDRIILPMREFCARLEREDACSRTERTYEFTLGPAPSPIGVAVYSTRGVRLAGGHPPQTVNRFAVTPQRGEDYLVVLSPSSSTALHSSFQLPTVVGAH
jgi:subtilisin family serine protease